MLVPKQSIPQSFSWRGEEKMSLVITPSHLVLCTAIDTGKAREKKKLVRRKPTLLSPATVQGTQNLTEQ